MKKTTILLSSALLLSLSGVVAAQNSRGAKGEKRATLTPDQREAKHAERREKRIVKLTKALSLTPAQSSTASQILAHKKNGIKQLRDSGADMRSPEMKEARRQLRLDAAGEIEAILTAEQREKFRKFKRKHRFDKRGLRRAGKAKRATHGRKGKLKNARKGKYSKAKHARKAKRGNKGKHARKGK